MADAGSGKKVAAMQAGTRNRMRFIKDSREYIDNEMIL
jgi:hypothetical protein